MKNTSKSKVEDWITDRPAPLLDGLFSMQAMGSDPTDPYVTIYRRDAASAIPWINNIGEHKQFPCYLLRSKSDHWTLFISIEENPHCPVSCPITEAKNCSEVVSVDRGALLQEARDLIGDPDITLLACSEGHAGASAADRSNFNVTCRRMIGDASPADLEQFYVFDSRMWPCPVTGVFANVSKLSTKMQDVLLDRYVWIKESWPLVQSDFKEHLADQLATLRLSYVCDLLKRCCRAASMSEEFTIKVTTKWSLASPGPKYRFALHIVTTLWEGLDFKQHEAETFTSEIVKSHGAAVVKDYKRYLTL